jgi:hypothetical protein
MVIVVPLGLNLALSSAYVIVAKIGDTISRL